MLGECRINPDPLPFNSKVRAVIEMQRGSPCRILFNAPSVAVGELTLTRQPVGGQVAIYNDSILVYRPNAGFHGADFFSFLARGTSPGRTSAASVDVSVTVY